MGTGHAGADTEMFPVTKAETALKARLTSQTADAQALNRLFRGIRLESRDKHPPFVESIRNAHVIDKAGNHPVKGFSR